MGLLKAVFGGVFRKVDEKLTDRDTQKAKDKAFANTGKKLRLAKENDYRINGSATYKKEFKKEMEKVERRSENRKQTWNDLWS